MFTGIVETMATIQAISTEGTNKRFVLSIDFLQELKVDQSVAHNGVCLTIEKINQASYEVVAIAETLSKTDLNQWQVGQKVNIERCMPANGRFDGHIVQGHVDATAIVTKIGEFHSVANACNICIGLIISLWSTGNCRVKHTRKL